MNLILSVALYEKSLQYLSHEFADHLPKVFENLLIKREFHRSAEVMSPVHGRLRPYPSPQCRPMDSTVFVQIQYNNVLLGLFYILQYKYKYGTIRTLSSYILSSFDEVATFIQVYAYLRKPYLYRYAYTQIFLLQRVMLSAAAVVYLLSFPLAASVCCLTPAIYLYSVQVNISIFHQPFPLKAKYHDCVENRWRLIIS